MKYLMTTLMALLICMPHTVVYAQIHHPNLIVSVTQPSGNNPVASVIFSGQESYLWRRLENAGIGCITDNRFVDYREGFINVYEQHHGTPCGPPPPPIPPTYAPVVKLNGLAEGVYTLNFYNLPGALTFPPSDSELSNYIPVVTEFEVLGSVSIDATSQWSVFLLILLILSVSGYLTKRIKL